MAHRRYSVELQDHEGDRVGLKVDPFVLLDFDSDEGIKEANRQLRALLADLSHTHDPYGEARVYRLAVRDAESGELIGHWTNL